MDMLEKVARALCRENCLGEPDAAFLDANWPKWTSPARAAIEAMRSVDVVMRDGPGVVHEIRGAPNEVWKAIFDAALPNTITIKHGTGNIDLNSGVDKVLSDSGDSLILSTSAAPTGRINPDGSVTEYGGEPDA